MWHVYYVLYNPTLYCRTAIFYCPTQQCCYCGRFSIVQHNNVVIVVVAIVVEVIVVVVVTVLVFITCTY